ncbi:prepilin-type N-terminal cleavage/methylation domain-containing protein [Paucihalobacter ruber]|uniref:Prepilin-type N-terminal cleavage/methylation domain-containing protein n=1 Tax=Paucihalobacter ruber TaxID=2567861 RepID=A0A506PPF2_9FLAO|nr:prepilin-type N-terminal cleavage/methylation domain-containing protein [Paucihalobacter ruber]TPV35105.1 prepilin-type N-terminal cleavage/methylation domain-containing protein [Paucihalobacter ruber]
MKLTTKVSAFNLQEVLIVLLIIGVFMLIALPNLMPLVVKAKSIEAQIQLKYLYNNQTTYRYLNSKYANHLDEIDFEAPKTVNNNGTSNYTYEIIKADNNAFTARATAVTDFDGDGVFNVWEITEDGIPKQIVKD